MKENSIKEDMKILEEIIKGAESCINAIYSQMKVKNDNDEYIQYYKKEIQSIRNIVDNYLKEKAKADKLEERIKEDFIPKSKIEEKITKLEGSCVVMDDWVCCALKDLLKESEE